MVFAVVTALVLVTGVVVVAIQVVAKRTMMVVSGAGRPEIRHACLACFSSPRWVPVSGLAVINMRRNGAGSRARSVVSVAIEDGTTGEHLVSAWLSRGDAWVHPADALTVHRIQARIRDAVYALPTSMPAKPAGR
jgi:hypothetical protein